MSTLGAISKHSSLLRLVNQRNRLPHILSPQSHHSILNNIYQAYSPPCLWVRQASQKRNTGRQLPKQKRHALPTPPRVSAKSQDPSSTQGVQVVIPQVRSRPAPVASGPPPKPASPADKYLASDKPVELYTAPRDAQFLFISMMSSAFCGLQISDTWQMYGILPYASMNGFIGRFLILVWAGFMLFTIQAPTKHIRSIRLLPKSQIPQGFAKNQPYLIIEPKNTLALKNESFTVPVSDVFKLLPIAPFRQDLRSKGVDLSGKGNPIVAFFSDMKNMFLKHTFMYLRIRDKGTFKMNMHGATILDDGAPIDSLINIDPTPARHLQMRQGRSPFMDDDYR